MNEKNEACVRARRGNVGGQALVEGVMMKSKRYTAIAVRRMDNKKISVSRKTNSSLADRYRICRLPLIRGVVNFAETMALSFSTITAASDMLGLEGTAEEGSKFDKWLEKHLGKWIMPVMTAISVILGVLLSVGLFIWLPTFVCNLLFGEKLAGGDFSSGVWRSLVEGVLKVLIFILYLWLTALIPDMKRVYQYHGAEHKSIFCYENGLELNVENVKKQSRFHPRCGTSFMFAMIFLSIFIAIAFLWPVQNVWLRSLLKLLLLPLNVGIGYEFIRYAGRHDNAFVRIVSQPGLWMQRLTTREPDAEIIEVGIAALKCALPDDFPEAYEEYLEAMKPQEEAPAEEAPAEEAPAEENVEPGEAGEEAGIEASRIQE